jgi:hypothetical protein
MVYGGFGMVFAMIGVWSSRRAAAGAWMMLSLPGQMWVGAASIACLWIPLLIGAKAVRQKQVLRWTIVSLLVLGLADAAHFLLGTGDVGATIVSSTRSILMWAAMLGLPMLVGARYLYLLTTPLTPPSSPPRSSGESQRTP